MSLQGARFDCIIAQATSEWGRDRGVYQTLLDALELLEEQGDNCDALVVAMLKALRDGPDAFRPGWDIGLDRHPPAAEPGVPGLPPAEHAKLLNHATGPRPEDL